jgi:type I restriction enzyme S subunit
VDVMQSKSKWPEIKLGEVLKERKEIPDPAALEDGEIRIISKITFDTGKIEFRTDGRTKTKMIMIQSGDLVVSGINAAKGAIAVYSDSQRRPAAATIHYGVYEVNAELADNIFLWWLLRSNLFRDILAHYLPGGIKTELKAKRLLTIPIPLPTLSEQRGIVEKIEQLAAKIDEAHGLKQLTFTEANALFQSEMQIIWKDQKDWARERMGNLISTVSGQVDPRIEPYASMPHINGESMESNTGRLLKNYRLAKEDGVKSGKYHFKKGAVLYSKIRPYLRKAVVVPFEGVCSADIYAIEKIDKQLDPSFLKYTLISQPFTAYANERSGRTRMPKLNQKQLFEYSMAFPSLTEQREIVAHLDNLQLKTDRLKLIQNQNSIKLGALLPSILDMAFRGEL